MGTYKRPSELAEALRALAARPCTILAGGTDHFPERATHEPPEDILDVSGLDLGPIVNRDGMWVLPATATWTDVIEAGLPPLFDGLVAAARQVGGRQIQNCGTLAGNICTASPAADGIPALLALDAVVELASVEGRRLVPLDEFVHGRRATARDVHEMVVALHVPDRAARSVFLKLGARAYLVISISMVAVTTALDAAGRVAWARVAVGSCGPRAVRLPGLEQALLGREVGREVVEAGHLSPLAPIDDVRGSAAYRRVATLELLRRAVAA